MKIELTENQREFLLNYFFKSEEFAGWKTIANKLLNNGFCTVAGKDCIWKGGVGNFIETKVSENGVSCIDYHFSLKYFLSYEWFKDVHNSYITKLMVEKERAIEKYNEIVEL